MTVTQVIKRKITGVLDFVHRPELKKYKTFRKLDLFPSSGEGTNAHTLLRTLKRAFPKGLNFT
jgi:hypothetical protein